MVRVNSRFAMGAITALLAFAAGYGIHASRSGSPVVSIVAQQSSPISPEEAIKAMRCGNRRFVESRRVLSTDTLHDADHRRETARGQHPFAVVLTCSDSRICPDMIFDQRIGSLFEIRNAGNVVDEDVLGSVEYAVEHFHAPLVVVMGHKGCGAIEAVCTANGFPLPDNVRHIQLHMPGIRAQIAEGHGRHDPGTVARVAKENARQQALAMRERSAVVRDAVEHGRCRVVYGLYDLDSGEVDFESTDD